MGIGGTKVLTADIVETFTSWSPSSYRWCPAVLAIGSVLPGLAENMYPCGRDWPGW